MNKYKSIITSLIMKKAHKLTKDMIKVDNTLDYRIQLSINIKYFLEAEKESWKTNQENKLLRNKALTWVSKYIKHGNNIHSEEMRMILDQMNYDLMINKFYWGRTYNKYHLANSLVVHHRKNVKMWA
jgi:hypothetical protein